MSQLLARTHFLTPLKEQKRTNLSSPLSKKFYVLHSIQGDGLACKWRMDDEY